MTFFYIGVNRRGSHVNGRFNADDCVDFVERKYRARWQDLRVSRTDPANADDLCGTIGTHPDTGYRTWWAETSN